MARKIQADTITMVNELVRYLHFDPRAKSEVLTKAKLANRLDLSYPNMIRVMSDKRFVSLWDEDIMGRVTLSGVVPDFLEGLIDWSEPYTPKLCGCRSSKVSSNMLRQSNTTGKKLLQVKHLKWETLENLLNESAMAMVNGLAAQDTINLRAIGDDPSHPYWQLQNLANEITVFCQMKKSKDPKKTAAELVDDPDSFEALKRILNGSATTTTTTTELTDNTNLLDKTGMTIGGFKMPETVTLRRFITWVKERLDKPDATEGFGDDNGKMIYYKDIVKELKSMGLWEWVHKTAP